MTDAVGIAQPSFYAHFANVQALIEAAAASIAEELLDLTRAAQAALRTAGPGDRNVLRDHYTGVLNRIVEHAPALRLYLRHRYADSRLGALCREVDAGVRADIVEHLLEVLGATDAQPALVHAAERMAAALASRVMATAALAMDDEIPVGQLADLLALETLCATTVFLSPPD